MPFLVNTYVPSVYAFSNSDEALKKCPLTLSDTPGI